MAAHSLSALERTRELSSNIVAVLFDRFRRSEYVCCLECGRFNVALTIGFFEHVYLLQCVDCAWHTPWFVADPNAPLAVLSATPFDH